MVLWGTHICIKFVSPYSFSARYKARYGSLISKNSYFVFFLLILVLFLLFFGLPICCCPHATVTAAPVSPGAVATVRLVEVGVTFTTTATSVAEGESAILKLLLLQRHFDFVEGYTQTQIGYSDLY